MKTIQLPSDWQGESCFFLEGAVLAANLAIQPLEPERWCEAVGVSREEVSSLLVPHIHMQHILLRRNDYSVNELGTEALSDLAAGFMTVWPMIEMQYQNTVLLESTERMLQALLTTFMLAIDEVGTREQMKQAGIDMPPILSDLVAQLDLMINEVAVAADEQMVGAKNQSINPYKAIGRNDPCPCNSGKKFKQCCGK